MPAIQPARLKKQALELAGYFDQPDYFVGQLHHYLDYYSERIQRAGQSGEPLPLLEAYKVRAPVLRQLQRELSPLVIADPQSAIDLCDALWEQPYLEFHLLAASLIGKVPIPYKQEVLERVQNWSEGDTENHIIDAILSEGLVEMRLEDPEQVLVLVDTWLSDTEIQRNRLAIQALVPMVDDLRLDVLPRLYRMVQPLTLSTPPKLRLYFLDLLRALVRRSPNETAFFLSTSLSHPEAQDTAWLIRQCLDEFPEEIADNLRAVARGSG